MKGNRILQIILLFMLAGCGSTEIIHTHQENSGVEVNGSLTDWPVAESLIHSSDSFEFYTMQDEGHLYILASFRSPFYNRAAENSGFILYLAGENDNRDRRGIGYPAGALNLLRDDPGTFREITRNEEWLYNPQNQQRLENLQDENFDRIMIVERFEDGTDPQYGFLSRGQVEAQGIEIAAEQNQRYYSIEYKIPLDGSPPFDLEPGNTYWLGFAIEPPDFNFRDSASGQQQYRQQGHRQRQPTVSDRRLQMRRQMGQYSEWFKIQVQ